MSNRLPSNRSRTAKKATVTTKVTTTRLAHPAPNSTRVRDKKRPQRGETSLVKYTRSLTNPFGSAPPLFGYDSFAGSSASSLWSRNIALSLGPTGTCFAAVYDPSTTVAAGIFGSSNSSYLRWLADPSPGTTLAGVTTAVSIAPIDTGIYNSTVDTHRPVTAAIRATVRYPMTSAPGRMFGLTIYESDATIAAMSFNSIIALPVSHPTAFDGSGVAVLQQAYKPMDEAAFAYTVPSSGYTAVSHIAKVLIIGVGWPVGTTVDIDTLAHTEVQIGALASPIPSSSSETLSMSITKDALGRVVRDVNLTLSKSDIALCQAFELRRAMERSTARRSLTRSVPMQARAAAAIPDLRSHLMEEEASMAASSGAGTDGAGYVNVLTHVAGAAAIAGSEYLLRRTENDGRRFGGYAPGAA